MYTSSIKYRAGVVGVVGAAGIAQVALANNAAADKYVN
jgi:hypothetical protein